MSFNIAAAKDSEQTYLPLLLAVFTFADGAVLRVASVGLASAEGGVQYGGNNYFGRVEQYSLSPIQGNYEGGIDIVPRVSITLADADKFVWLNYQETAGRGFAGASVDLTFVFHDLATGDFSTDSVLKFRGVCDPAKASHDQIAITATNKLNLQRRSLPVVSFQRRCPWINPTTTAQRALASNEDSIYYECGETRDLTTAPPCQYTKATCTQPDRRGGIEYTPPSGGPSREYTSDDVIQIRNAPSQVKYGDPIPMVYGKAWVDAAVMSVIGDGNSTRGEAVLCLGKASSIEAVLVNDVFLQAATQIDGTPAPGVVEPLLRYNVLNQGDRDGAENLDSPWNGEGDPYGSMCAIEWVVPRRVAEASSIPRVRALIQGAQVRVYTDASTYTREYSDNPAWVLLDLLIWSGLSYSDIDLASFVTAAATCAGTVSYTNQYGASGSHARYACSLVLSRKQSAAEVIRQVRQGFGAILIPNTSTGKLKLLIEGTLSAQQSGSYRYDFQKVLMRGDRSSLSIAPADLSSTPNKVSFQFINSEADHTVDSLTMLDAGAVALAGQEVAAGLDVAGINTLDQAKRIAARMLAKGIRGNGRSDRGGTDVYEFDYSFGAVNVQAGDICKLTDAHHELTDVPIRTLSIQPSHDFRTCRIVAARHDDAWYADSFGQEEDPSAGARHRDRLARPSYPWGPRWKHGRLTDPIFSPTEYTFGLEEIHETAADGTSLPVIRISGIQTVNVFSPVPPPTVSRQGTTASSGGSLVGSGQQYFLAVAGVDGDGLLTNLSNICTVAVSGAGTSHTVTVPIIDWPAGITGYRLYAGKTPYRLTQYTSASGSTPSSITMTSYEEWSYGAPDSEMDRMRVRVGVVAHGGVIGAAVTARNSTTITIAASGLTVDQFAGYDIQIIGQPGEDLEVLNFAISANTADGVFTVSPSPSGFVSVGDVLLVLSKPTVGSDGTGFYLEDANWANAASSPTGLNTDEEVGRIVRIIAGPGRGQTRRIKANTDTKLYLDSDWGVQPTSASRYIVQEPTWEITQDSDSLNNSDPLGGFYMSIPTRNYLGKTLLVKAYTLDGSGNESFEAFSPERMIYISGEAGDGGVTIGYALDGTPVNY